MSENTMTLIIVIVTLRVTYYLWKMVRKSVEAPVEDASDPIVQESPSEIEFVPQQWADYKPEIKGVSAPTKIPSRFTFTGKHSRRRKAGHGVKDPAGVALRAAIKIDEMLVQKFGVTGKDAGTRFKSVESALDTSIANKIQWVYHTRNHVAHRLDATYDMKKMLKYSDNVLSHLAVKDPFKTDTKNLPD